MTTGEKQSPYAPYSPDPNGEYPRDRVVTAAAAVTCSREGLAPSGQSQAANVLDLNVRQLIQKNGAGRDHEAQIRMR